MTAGPREPRPSEPSGSGASTLLNVYSATGGASNVGLEEHDRPSITPPLALLPRVLHGREELKATLVSAMPPKDRKLWVLHGIPGGGKSTLALWLARQAIDQGRPVYWIRNNDVTQSMLSVAANRKVDPGQIARAQANNEQSRDLVWRALEAATEPWVLIFDNVDNIAKHGVLGTSGERLDGTGWIRPSSAGLVVVTSREEGVGHMWGPDAILQRVSCLDDSDGARLLTELAPAAGSRPDAELLAHQLGGLPLALRLAGSYLAGRPLRHRTFASYREAVRRDLELLDAGEPTPANLLDEESARRSIRLTWELSLGLLTERGLAAARPLLQLLACYGAPHPIPTDLLDAAGLRDAPVDWGRELTGAYLDQVLRGLVSSALVDRADLPGDPAIACVAMHPLLAEVISTARDGDAASAKGIWAAAVGLLNGFSSRTSESKLWATLPAVYAAVLTNLPETFAEAMAVGVEEGSKCAAYLLKTGQMHAAHDMSELVLRRADTLAADHPVRLDARLAAAVVNGAQGSAAAVREELITLLADARDDLPADAPFLIVVRQQLAQAYWSTGHHDEAELLYRELFAEHELGQGLEVQLTTRLGYGQMLSNRGEFGLAEREISEVLAAKRAAIDDPDHPELLLIRALLADIWVGLGRLPEARDELQAVLRSQERIHGPDSPLTLAARVTLMHVLAMLSDRGGAQVQLGQLLRIQRDALNPEHPLALIGLAALINTRATSPEVDTDPVTDARRLTELAAMLARTRGDDDPIVLSTLLSAAIQRYLFDSAGAEQTIESILARQSGLFGPEHVTTLSTRLVRAQLLVESDRDNPAAEAELRNLLEAQIRAVGTDHPQTALVRSALANITLRNGDLDSSESFLRDALESLQRLHGPDHADTWELRTALVTVLSRRNRFADAERELLVLSESLERAAPETDDVLAAQLMLALIRWQDSRRDEAEQDLRRLLATLRRLRPDQDRDDDVLIVSWMLAELLQQLGSDRYPEAEELYKAVLAGYGDEHDNAPAVRAELGEVLHERGKLHEAEHHLQLAVALLPDDGDGLAMRARHALTAVAAELQVQVDEAISVQPQPEPATEPDREPAPTEPDGRDGWHGFLDGTATRPPGRPSAVPTQPVRRADNDRPAVLRPVPPAPRPRPLAESTWLLPTASPSGATAAVVHPYRAAMTHCAQGRWDDAERAFRAFLARPGNRSRSADARSELVRLHLTRGRLADAERHLTDLPDARAELIMLRRERCATYREDAMLCAELVRDLTGPPVNDPRSVLIRHHYALALADLGFPAAAHAELCTVVAGHDRLGSGLASVARQRARVDATVIRPDHGGDDPLARVDRLRRELEDEVGPEHDLVLRLRRGRVELNLVRGRGAETVAELNDLLAARIRLSPSANLEKAMLRHDLALAIRQGGDLAGAERLHRQVVMELTALLGQTHPRVLLARAALAAVHADRGIPDASLELREVLRAQLRRRGPHHPDVATTRHELALAAGPQARDELRLAVGIRTRRLGANHPLTHASRSVMATA